MCHRAHFFRQGIRDTSDPFNRFFQRHFTGLIKRDPHQLRCAGFLRQACAMAFGADILLQEFFHTLHTLFVLDLAQRVHNGCRCAVIGKIHFAGGRCVCLFRAVEDMLLFHGTIKDDLFFPLSQVFKRNIRPYTHGSANVCHQGPHQGIPGSDSAVINGDALIRNQGASVHCPDCACPSAAFAGSLRIERKFFRPGTVKAFAAFRAYDLLHQCHLKPGLHIVSIGTTVG